MTQDSSPDRARDGAPRLTAGTVKPELPGSVVPRLETREYEGRAGDPSHITRSDRGLVPVTAIALMPGARGEVPGEHTTRSPARWEQLKAELDRDGIRDPLLIIQDWDRPAVISEGNNRRDWAVERGLALVPAEIRYFGHAERQCLVHERDATALAGGPSRPAGAASPEARGGIAGAGDFEDPRKVYLRFGDWPRDERSRNNITGIPEEGVSVYELGQDGDPVDPDPNQERGHVHHDQCAEDCDLDDFNDEYGNDTGEEMSGRVRRAEQNRYRGQDLAAETGHLVRGDVIGLGHDAEPLLRNLRRVGDWIDDRHRLIPGARPHPLARSPRAPARPAAPADAAARP